jgi:uncharacterized repeat protein (TIGR01451 family)
VIESRAEGLLTEVGSEIGFVVTVTNVGSEALEEIVVVDLVPAEIDVLGVDFVDGVDAVQFGQHQGQADIVWVLAPLAADASVELTWTGRAARRGDLLALNSVEARVEGKSLELSQFTAYLAGEDAMGVSNPPYRRVDRRVVVQRVPVPAVLGAALPATGAPLRDLALLGVGLVVTGIALLGAARDTRRGLSAALVALFLVAAACTGSEPEVAQPSSPGPTESPRSSPPSEEEDRVRGRRIEREPEGERERDRAPDATATAEVPPAPPQRFEIVRDVRRVVVRAGDLPASSLDSRSGDNVLTYVFDADADRIVEASSSLLAIAGATVEVVSGVSLVQGTLETTGTVRNLSPRSRLRVHGRIVLEIHREGGGVAVLRSDEIDVTLAPRGEVVTPFSHLLPSGEYRVETSFQASS